MLHTFYFSPSGTTKATVDILSGSIGTETVHHDMTVDAGQFTVDSPDDTVLIAAPVYAGRIPPVAAARLSGVRGKGQKAVVIVVYGNRDYDDALVELCDIAAAQGFKVVAAGAFVGQHCIFPLVAASRPDEGDRKRIIEFARLVNDAFSRDRILDVSHVKGNRPYKKIVGVPLHPKTDRNLCSGCGTCARECPADAIPVDKPWTTDGQKCITCCRCIQVCPQDARSLGGLLYKVVGWKFVKDNARRREAEWFIA